MTHTVTLEPSGRSFTVEGGEHILDAALRDGVSLPYGCRGGTCRSCRAEIISGEVAYPNGVPSILGNEQAGSTRWSLLCQATAIEDLTVKIDELDLGAEFRIVTLPCRVVSIRQAASDVMVLTLRFPEGESFNFLAGQYVDILMRDGRRRSFSIANAPRSDNQLMLHIRHVPDGEFSGYVFTHMKEKALLRLRGPLGSFYLRDESRPLIFVAGGTGLAPIYALLESCLEKRTECDMHLYWGVRSRDDLYFHDELSHWQQTYTHFHYTPVLSEPHEDQGWNGRTGFVHEAVLVDFPDLSAYSVYSSGPPVMVDAAWRTFATHGLPAEHHFSDAFEFAYETGADSLD